MKSKIDEKKSITVQNRKEDISINLPFKYKARDAKVKKFQWRHSAEFKQILEEHSQKIVCLIIVALNIKRMFTYNLKIAQDTFKIIN